jgi:hypothetical protein
MVSSTPLLIGGIISLSIAMTIRRALPSNDCPHSDIIIVNMFVIEIIFLYSMLLLSRQCSCCTISSNDDNTDTDTFVVLDNQDVKIDVTTPERSRLKPCFTIPEDTDSDISLQDVPLRLIDNDNDDDCIQFIPSLPKSRRNYFQQCFTLSFKSSKRMNNIVVKSLCATCIYSIFYFLHSMNSLNNVLLCTIYFVLSINDYYRKHVVNIRESNPLTPTVQLYSSVICSRLQDYTLYPTVLIIYGTSLALHGVEVVNDEEWGTLNISNVLLNYMIPVCLPLGINICIRTQSVKDTLENSIPFLSFICALSSIISFHDIECITMTMLDDMQHFGVVLTLLALPISYIITTTIVLMLSRNKNNIHVAIVFTCIGIALHDYNRPSMTGDHTPNMQNQLGSWATLCITIVVTLCIIYDCVYTTTVV